MRNMFFEKSCTKCRGETIPRPFSKKSKLDTFLDKWFKVLTLIVFIVCHVEGFHYILKLSCRSLDFTSYKAF